jgi:hypothetical protein
MSKKTRKNPTFSNRTASSQGSSQLGPRRPNICFNIYWVALTGAGAPPKIIINICWVTLTGAGATNLNMTTANV